jgi:threonine dehydrogenase-like Zn-dependent dehydrogenase
MARCLIIGCGCRGLALTFALRDRGHAVRATTRDPGRVAEIRAAGAEPVVGDPDRVSTIAPAFAHIGVVCVLLGSATGSPEQLQALHSTRLDMLMEKMIDTTSRGIVYETVGSVDADLLAAGAERVRWWCDRSLIAYALLDAPTVDSEAWTRTAADAVDEVLLGRTRSV